jgi:phenylalanyl-tRNA synthetase alpha chain
MFYQCEGLVIDKNISMAHLLGLLETYLKALFEKKELSTRLRPSYFPFVEPGVEVDITCPFCKNGCSTCKHSGWIELGGAGLVHPNVLRFQGIDPQKWNGCAWGFGLTRLAMLMYGIPDIRLLHESKISFLSQF